MPAFASEQRRHVTSCGRLGGRARAYNRGQGCRRGDRLLVRCSVQRAAPIIEHSILFDADFSDPVQTPAVAQAAMLRDKMPSQRVTKSASRTDSARAPGRGASTPEALKKEAVKAFEEAPQREAEARGRSLSGQEVRRNDEPPAPLPPRPPQRRASPHESTQRRYGRIVTRTRETRASRRLVVDDVRAVSSRRTRPPSKSLGRARADGRLGAPTAASSRPP